MDPLSLLWIYFILASLQPFLQRQQPAAARRRRLRRLSNERGATVITLIHRQETMSPLGFQAGMPPARRPSPAPARSSHDSSGVSS